MPSLDLSSIQSPIDGSVGDTGGAVGLTGLPPLAPIRVGFLDWGDLVEIFLQVFSPCKLLLSVANTTSRWSCSSSVATGSLSRPSNQSGKGTWSLTQSSWWDSRNLSEGIGSTSLFFRYFTELILIQSKCYQQFKQTLCVSYFTELVFGSIDNWPVIKSDTLCELYSWVDFRFI